ncbi:uncharacterized protein LOC126904486 isoform X2 [Daktulosphaira vitifoliae]|uniref:uncharacterized protein LOC126904486 isoform X2 n=1 Tax=Daktulosphaira vitifoliae TaxID=58002 RepID=UPI0021A9C75D|nr:uncharacterized protein LOC126904486 isoform X2 [Daktulosphaira vitifoliae]
MNIMICNMIILNDGVLDKHKYNEYVKANANLMDLKIMSHQIYTAPETMKADLETLNFNLNINYTAPTPAPPSEPYRCTAPVAMYQIDVVGRTLHDIVKEARIKEQYFEGMAWIRNVIESIGISLLINYCKIIKMLLNILHVKLKGIMKEYTNQIVKLKAKFEEYLIRTEPIDKFVENVNKYSQVKPCTKSKTIFQNDCNEFINRYSNCSNLVRLQEWNNLDFSNEKCALCTTLRKMFFFNRIIRQSMPKKCTIIQ